MFEWYRCAQVCYSYLSDVSSASQNPRDADSEFRRSKWWTRGWTLQELLCPHWLQFYDRDWCEIGSKSNLRDLITSITGISHLFDFQSASVAQKMSWASRRQTARIEDQAYCLMGLFNVHIPPLYGEGEHAFVRLQVEILNQIDDESLFAWTGHGHLPTNFGMGLLAPSPAYFQRSGKVKRLKWDLERTPHTMTSKGVRLEVPSTRKEKWEDDYEADVVPLEAGDELGQLALLLYRNTSGTYNRKSHLSYIELKKGGIHKVKFPRSVFYVSQPRPFKGREFPSKLVFDTRCLEAMGFTYVGYKQFPRRECAKLSGQKDPRGPVLRILKSTWHGIMMVFEKEDQSITLFVDLSKEGLWVDFTTQDVQSYIYESKGKPEIFLNMGNLTTDRISRSLPDSSSITLFLKKDPELGNSGYVLEVSVDPYGGIPWPAIAISSEMMRNDDETGPLGSNRLVMNTEGNEPVQNDSNILPIRFINK